MLITRSELGHFIHSAYCFGFIVVFLILLVITFRISKTVKGRIKGGVISLFITSCVFILPLVPRTVKKQKAIKLYKEKYRSAEEIFKERCKTAGEKIYRTVDDVEGITLLRVPKPYKNAYQYDPMWEDAALRQRADYIYSFLGTTFPNYTFNSFLIKPKKHYSKANKPYTNPIYGYSYVDIKNDDKYLRYMLSFGKSNKAVLPTRDKPARYAVSYDTKVVPAERQYWIAGAVIKIIDTENDSILAEKTIYVFDDGMGAGAERKSGRQPWNHAKKCPTDEIKANEARFFAEKVLKPKQPNFN